MFISIVKEWWLYQLSVIREWWHYQRQMAAWRRSEAKDSADMPHCDDYAIEECARNAEKSDQWRRLILTRFLRFQADRLEVDFPNTADQTMFGRVEWDDDESEPYYLTDLGLRLAQERIRAEKKHRREVVAFWIASVVGFIGAITGMISVLKN